MKKLMTLATAATLMVSSVVFASQQTSGSSNDILQQIPAPQAQEQGSFNVADAGTVATDANAAATPDANPAAAAAANAEDTVVNAGDKPAAEPKKHAGHKKHHNKHHHHHKKAHAAN